MNDLEQMLINAQQYIPEPLQDPPCPLDSMRRCSCANRPSCRAPMVEPGMRCVGGNIRPIYPDEEAGDAA